MPVITSVDVLHQQKGKTSFKGGSSGERTATVLRLMHEPYLDDDEIPDDRC